MFGCIHDRLNRKNIATWSSQCLRIKKTYSVYLLAVHRSEQNCLYIVFRLDKRSESVVQSMMTLSLVELVTEWAKLYHKVDIFPRDQAPLVSNICQNQYWRSLLQHTSYPVCATNSHTTMILWYCAMFKWHKHCNLEVHNSYKYSRFRCFYRTLWGILVTKLFLLILLLLSMLLLLLLS